MKIDVTGPDQPLSRPAHSAHGKVFDVRRPGRAPASATSRPVVVSHKHHVEKAQTAVSGIGARAQHSQHAKPATEATTKAEAIEDELMTEPTPEQTTQLQAIAVDPDALPPPETAAGAQAPAHATELAILDDTTADVPLPAHVVPAAEATTNPPVAGPLPKILAVIAFVLLLAVLFDILLDSGVLTLNVPHTHFFG